MTYQIIYSSQSTRPMQLDALEALLQQARHSNGAHGITGALVYADGIFLQILEGERVRLEELMGRIRMDPRHDAVTVLRDGDIPSALFSGWKMAYVGATAEQVARWAGLTTGSMEAANDSGEDPRRTAQFAEDILALLRPDEPGVSG